MNSLRLKKKTHLIFFFLPLFYQTSLVTFNFYSTLQFTHTHKKKQQTRSSEERSQYGGASQSSPHFNLTNFIWLHNTKNNKIILNFSSTLHTQICHLIWLNNNHEKNNKCDQVTKGANMAAVAPLARNFCTNNLNFSL